MTSSSMSNQADWRVLSYCQAGICLIIYAIAKSTASYGGEPEGSKSFSLEIGWMAKISPRGREDHINHVFLASDSFIHEQSDQRLELLINPRVRGGEFIENNLPQATVTGENHTGSKTAVFETVLTNPANRITYTNRVANENDKTTIANNEI